MLIIFILFHFSFALPKTQNILCSNKNTADQLLFNICSFDKYCSEIYNIPFFNMDITTKIDIHKNNEFQNFNYIISKIGLSYPTSISTFVSNVNYNSRTLKINEIDLENGLYFKLWSSDWKRSYSRINYIVFNDNNQEENDVNENLVLSKDYEILFNQSFNIENLIHFNQYNTKCLFVDYNNNISTFLIDKFFNSSIEEFNQFINNTVDIFSPSIETWNVILSNLYILTIFKEHISMNEICNDINERLYFDPEESQLKCVCLEGKYCDSETNDSNTVLWVFLLGFGVLIIVCIVLLFTSATIIGRSSSFKKNKKT
jgi:hypothetical protein